MNQKFFSEKVLQFLETKFPEFIDSVKHHNDASFDCEKENPTEQFAMWIATYNVEITFGLKSPEGETDIHTHVSCYDEEDIDDCLFTLTKLINEIKTNKVILYKNESNKFDWIQLDTLTKKENKRKMTFEKLLWDG